MRAGSARTDEHELSDQSDIRKEMHRLIDLGMTPLVLHGIHSDGRCTCGNPPASTHAAGKHPRGRWNDAEVHTHEEVDAIQGVFNVGARTGIRSMFNVDIDRNVDLARATKYLDAHNVPYFTTGRKGGGLHVCVRSPYPHRSFLIKREDGENIGSFLGDASITVLPPSRHSVGEYKWIVGLHHIQVVNDAASWCASLMADFGIKILPPGEGTVGDYASNDDLQPRTLDDLPPSVASRLPSYWFFMSGQYKVANDASCDSSGRLFGWAMGIIDAYRREKLDPDVEIVAGIIKALDEAVFIPPWVAQEGRTRRDASRRYRETVLGALNVKRKRG